MDLCSLIFVCIGLRVGTRDGKWTFNIPFILHDVFSYLKKSDKHLSLVLLAWGLI